MFKRRSCRSAGLRVTHSAEVDVLLPIRDPNVVWLDEALQSIYRQRDVSQRLIAVLHPDNEPLQELLLDAPIPVELIWAPRVGNITHALNAGLEACTAPFVARLDADDLAEPIRLAVQSEILRSDLNCVLVASDTRLINACGVHIGLRRTPSSSSQMMRRIRWKCPIVHSSVMFRTDLVKDLGGYSTAAKGAEDYELWLKLKQHGDLVVISEPLTRYRLHGEQVSKREHISWTTSRTVQMARLALARSRGESVIAADARHYIWWTKQKLRRWTR